jgi:hypothetical protein
MTTKTSMGCFTLFISVFYLVGFGMLGYGLWAARRSTQATDWPTAPGTLTRVDLKTNSDGDGTTYQVEVQYTYRVGGDAYTGSRLAFGYTGSGGREAHAAIYEKLKDARSVDVRYDPEDPAASVLSFGIHRSIQLILIFAIVWLVFVVGFTVIWWLAASGDSVLLKNLSVQ